MSKVARITIGRFVSACALAATLAAFTLWTAIEPLTGPGRAVTGDPSIRLTAFDAVLAWCIGGGFGAWAQHNASRYSHRLLKCGRLVYTWACALTLLHIAVALHIGHAWSHRNAYRHVEELSGFGAGIYVNYIFALVWLADVVWSWAAFNSYLSRSRWLSWLLLAFMAFIVFNAAIVFGTGTLRIVSGLFFVLPLVLLWETRPWARRE